MKSPFIALLVAGGGGTRLGGKLPKQFQPLAGKPLLYWPLKRLAAEPAIERVVLVLPAAHLARGKRLAATLPVRLRQKILFAVGGAERQDSVLNGLAHCGADDIVLVHDAARPLLSGRDLKALLAAARRGPALLGRPVTSTMKSLRGGVVHATVNRDALFIAETPQAALAALLRRALLDARAASFSGTDDASYIERLGLTLIPVTAHDPNFKITTPDELKLARLLMR